MAQPTAQPLSLSRRYAIRAIVLGVVLVQCATLARAQVPDDDAPQRGPRAGKLLRVTAPISTSVIRQVIGEAQKFIAAVKREGKWPVVVFEIEPGKTSDFEESHKLARKIISDLEGATTVAYLGNDAEDRPAPLRGHAVLVALACEQLALHPDGAIGEANAGEAQLSQTMITGYREMARARGTLPEDLAVALLDPSLEIWEVQRPDGRREFLSPSQLEALKKKATVRVGKRWIEAGKTGLIKGQDAASMGLVDRDHLVANRSGLAKALGLPPEALEDDPFWSTTRHAAIFPIAGVLNPGDVGRTYDKIKKMVDDDNINLIVLEINSPGGTATAGECMDLANYLSDAIRPSQRRTVAFITHEAAGDAVFLALACDHVVMMPDAVLGGKGALTAEQIEIAAPGLQVNAKKKGRSASLARALIDSKVRVHQYVRKDGLVAYFTEAEHQAQPDRDQWERQNEITAPGKALALTAEQAVEFRMASEVVQSYEALKDRYRLTYDPPRVESDWLDVLLSALKDKWVLGALLMIGTVAFYAEMHSPGTGVGGFIATCCFLLYFWGNFLGGSADWLEILMFLVGIVLILLEIFVFPGFGIIGIGGGLLVLASLVMAMHTFRGLPATHQEMVELRDSLTVVTLAAIGAIGCGAMLRRYLPSTPGLSDFVLAPPDDAAAEHQQMREAPSRYDHLTGEIGVAITQLTPSGKVQIGTELFDVITEGDVIGKGDAVIVVQTLGNRIVVRAAS